LVDRVVPPGVNHYSFLPPTLWHFHHRSLREHQHILLENVFKYRFNIIRAPTGYGKSELVLSALWGYQCTLQRQLWIFAKTKSQLQQVFLRFMKEKFCYPPAGCPDKSKAKYLERHVLLDLMLDFTLGSCPETFKGYRQKLSRHGCPYDLIRRMLPKANIILVTHGYLELGHLRAIIQGVLSKANRYGFTPKFRDVIIDEAHNFGPVTQAQITREQLEKALEIAPFKVVKSLLGLFDLPQGYVDMPVEIKSSDLKELGSYFSRGRLRYGVSHEDYEALLAVKNFVQHQSMVVIHDEEVLHRVDPYPDIFIAPLTREFYRMILLSATFLGSYWYTLYYGISKTNPKFRMLTIYPSTEKRSQMFVAGFPFRGVSSKPRNRTPRYIRWSTFLILSLSLLVGDHTLVFIPSYEYLEQTYSEFQSQIQGEIALYKEPASGNVPFLKKLLYGPPAIVLAVYGGKFSEGIEIIHPETGLSRFRFVVLNGLPFPPPTAKYRFIRYLHARRYNSLTFLQWALLHRNLFTSVHQCLGRAIRSKHDRAVGLVLDYRVFRPYFRFVRPYFSYNALFLGLSLRLTRIKRLNRSYEEG